MFTHVDEAGGKNRILDRGEGFLLESLGDLMMVPQDLLHHVSDQQAPDTIQFSAFLDAIQKERAVPLCRGIQRVRKPQRIQLKLPRFPERLHHPGNHGPVGMAQVDRGGGTRGCHWRGSAKTIGSVWGLPDIQDEESNIRFTSKLAN